jgi:hypothetical protein
MNLPQIILAGFCLVIGLFPLTAVKPLYEIVSSSLFGRNIPAFEKLFGTQFNGFTIAGNGAYAPLALAVVFVVCMIISFVIMRSASSKVKIVDVWYCGEEYRGEHVRYKASGFYLPIINIIEKWLIPNSEKNGLKLVDIIDFDRFVYFPFADWIIKQTGRVRRTHVGIPQVYMLWLVGGIIAVVIIMFLFAK